MSGTLQEVDSLLNDFNRELSSYVEDLNFDDETFYETEKRLDLINNLKAKYGQSIEEIQKYGEVPEAETGQILTDMRNCFQECSEHKSVKSRQKKLDRSFVCTFQRSGKQYSTDTYRQDHRRSQRSQFPGCAVSGLHFKRSKKSIHLGGFDDIEYEISTNPGESL